MRYAIYFTPEQHDPLTRLAADWLGRDPFTGAATKPPASTVLSPAEIAFHTASARRYGFHATLKAPFRLAEGESQADLEAAMAEFARATAPVVIPQRRQVQTVPRPERRLRCRAPHRPQRRSPRWARRTP